MFYVTCNDISAIYVTAQMCRRSGQAPNAIDISQGSITCPSYTNKGPPFLYGDSDTPPHLVAFYDTLGIRRTYSRPKPPASSRGRSNLAVRSYDPDTDFCYMCTVTLTLGQGHDTPFDNNCVKYYPDRTRGTKLLHRHDLNRRTDRQGDSYIPLSPKPCLRGYNYWCNTTLAKTIQRVF